VVNLKRHVYVIFVDRTLVIKYLKNTKNTFETCGLNENSTYANYTQVADNGKI
jgi:hypothetical protein